VKAKPVRRIKSDRYGGYEECSVEEATHVRLRLPGPTGELTLPIIIKGTREGTNCWSWNGSTDKPTLRPSVSTTAHNWKCHSLINDGQVQFLSDCSHELANTIVPLLDV
jgi:hypothetical protein